MGAAPLLIMSYHKRNLPHWVPNGSSVFVTYRLHGSLPPNVIQSLKETQRLVERDIFAAAKSPDLLADLRLKRHKQLFARIDSALDKAAGGPRWLSEPEIASLVETTLLSRCASFYKLWAYVVMSNHVHLLLRPRISEVDTGQPIFNSLSTITKSLKGYTAREANRLLGRTGQPFWQQESFDHWPRDETEFRRVISYIENNPVKAGLVAQPQDWCWSSAAERKRRRLSQICSLT
jgi:REP element-mobilizing transposase RayT